MKRRMIPAVLMLSAALAAGQAGGMLTWGGVEENAASTASEAVLPEEIGESGTDSGEDTDQEGLVELSRIRYAKDYRDVYEALKSAREYRPVYYDLLEVSEEEDAAADFEVAAMEEAAVTNSAFGAEAGGSAAADYSETNLRTEGVDEADVVKTDGTNLYILRKKQDLFIVRAEGTSMKQTAVIRLADVVDWNNPGAREFFVNGNLLHVVTEEQGSGESGYGYGYYNRVTKLITYDISNPASPVKTGEMSQDGSYLQARMKDGYLYLFTGWRPDVEDTYEDSNLIPHAGGREIPAEAICIPNLVVEAAYLLVAAVDPERPSEATDCKALVSGSEQLYVSRGSIYSLNTEYTWNKERTEIVKLAYEEGRILGRAAGTVRGSVSDTFAIDEYDGSLRVLTTYTGSIRLNLLEALGDLLGLELDLTEDRWTRHNALFVLDDSLHMTGRIVDLAPGEEIKSARYFGDTAYFVTFRNTDPLFTVDLTDPKAPVITDELKVSGFSDYLHPFGDNTLLGLGYEAEEETGRVTGLKLSLFDLGDPEGVKETDRTVIRNITWLPALSDYKAIFADASRKLVGFYLEDRYLVYHLDENGGFRRVLLYDLYEDDLQGSTDFDGIRGLYIGDVFYVAGEGGVRAFSMDGGEEFTRADFLSLIQS